MKPGADWSLTITEQPEQQAQAQRAPPALRSAHSAARRHLRAADRQKHANVASKASEKFRPCHTKALFQLFFCSSVRGEFRIRQTGVSGSGKFLTHAPVTSGVWAR